MDFKFMNVYCFYEPINEPWINHSDQNDLIEIWKKSWSYYGWTPVIYGIKECENCDGYEELYNACQKLPTVNSKKYEMYCFLRWLYMSKVGGWYADMDMINYGFFPIDYGEKIVTTWVAIHCSSICMPPNKYKKIIDDIINFKISEKDYYGFDKNGNKKPHVSDISILSSYKDIDIKLDIFKEYPYYGYDVSLITHYPLNCMFSEKEKLTRTQIILKDERAIKFL